MVLALNDRIMVTLRDSFLARFSFPLDPFQVESLDALDKGHSVLVAAPTGAGKTIVGEYAVHMALSRGVKVFYTAPIKALSNQKYEELVSWLGHERVGLITGDHSINPEAEAVVMTTEILRNMMYADSPTLWNLGYVVMDEVHYLADRFRGPVWEEIIIHLPRSVQLVALSATVSNVEEFGAWIEEVRGSTDVIVSERRPIPLWQHVLHDHELIDVFVDDEGNPVPSHGPQAHRRYREVNPALSQIGSYGGGDEMVRSRKPRSERGGRRGYRSRRAHRQITRDYEHGKRHSQQIRRRGMSRADVVHTLEAEGMLPAIFFIFSRSGCDLAVQQLMRANVSLTSAEDRAAVKAAFRAAFADLSPEDAYALRISQIEKAALHGVAAHHAGQLPGVKRVIEELFSAGHISVVCATETLALGINMPARTVVLDKLTKFNGVEHAKITPGEYTQLTGRAGRRGIDVQGHAVVVVSDAALAHEVAGLASTRTYPLRSAFHPTYNMTVNLVDRYPLREVREILETSFAQFHVDRSVVSQARRARELEDIAEKYGDAVTCDAGDIAEYGAIVEQISAREKQLSQERATKDREVTRSTVGRLRRGDIIAIPGGRRNGFALVAHHDKTVKGPQITVVTTEGQVRHLHAGDFVAPPMVLDTMRSPSLDRLRSARTRKDTAAALREKLRGERSAKDAVRSRAKTPSTAANDPQLRELREKMRSHPCHSCPERDVHMRWIVRYRKARRDHEKALRTISERTSFLSRQCDRIRGVLEALGYVEPEYKGRSRATAKGQLLQRIYSERDIVACEALDSGVLDGLSPPALAAVASALCYEPRREDTLAGHIEDRSFARALHALGLCADKVNEYERQAGLDLTPEPHPGLAAEVWRWANGAGFAAAVRDNPVTPGDFVRHVRLVIDLLDHLAHVPGNRYQGVAAVAKKARLQLLRGIVAQDM